MTGDRAIQTRAVLDVPDAHFTPQSAALDQARLALGADLHIQFNESVFGYIRYDTRRGENLIEDEGWIGVSARF
ncbi:MAG: hypothetical protein NXH72_07090 [Hyphomonadaceae bacterium]|nr:hypothetical protein [Hyphomonadaceae bacterium]